MKSIRKKRFIKPLVLAGLLIVPLYFGFSTKTPEGTSYMSPAATVTNLEFLYDLTYTKDEELVHEHSIFSEQLKMIENAERFIVADLFLYNDYYNTETFYFPNSTQLLTDAFITQKKKYPDLKVYLITDEINNSYGPVLNNQLLQLKENDIEVIITDSSKIRDSNPLYAGFYRTYIQHFKTPEIGWMNNPFGDNGPEVGIRNYLKLLNFKANHRKVLITENEGMVSSSNPHDASSHHSNIAFQFSGEAVSYLLEAEKAIAKFSGVEIQDVAYESTSSKVLSETTLHVLTEDKILNELLKHIKNTKDGDRIDLGMFYLSHREVIEELIAASERNVSIRVILDPNKDAFGFKKNGIPNRQVANELLEESNGNIELRWYLTNGEQFHAKIIAIHTQEQTIIIGGSANFTRRNLDNYNMEADIMIIAKSNNKIVLEVLAYFDRIWNNEQGVYTGDYSIYEEDSSWKSLIYKVQEKTGFSTF